jgi:hypothetical protein
MRQVYVPALLLALAAPVASASAATIQVYFNDFDGDETHAPGVTGGFGGTATLAPAAGGGNALDVPTAPTGGGGGARPPRSSRSRTCRRIPRFGRASRPRARPVRISRWMPSATS